MKTRRIRSFIGGVFAAALVGSSTLVPAPANAAPRELIYAVDQYNNLFSFYSDQPQFLLTQNAIGGLFLNEEIRGLDYYNGSIYGLGSLNHLYILNPNNAFATQVGPGLAPILNGASFGFDNGPSGVRLVSNLGQNLLINRTTAAVTVDPNANYVAGDPFFGFPPRVDGLAYDDATGIWYAADTLQNTLATFNPATGGVSTIGAIGFDPSTRNGMDISPFTGIMYMGTPAASSDPQANLYMVNKATGMASLVGQIDVPMANTLVRGLTVVPEPGSVTLLLLGAFGLLCARRRQS